MTPFLPGTSNLVRKCCSATCAMEHSLSIRKSTEKENDNGEQKQEKPSSSSADTEITRTTEQFKQLQIQPEIDQTISTEGKYYPEKSAGWLNTIDEIQEHWMEIITDGHFIWNNPGTGGSWPEEKEWTWNGHFTNTLF